MKVFVIAIAALCSCSWAASTVSSDLKVLSVEREIDLGTQIVREKLSIELENGGSAQISEYIHTVEASHAKHLAYIEAFAGDGDSKKPLKLDKTQIPNKEHAFYAVKFADPLSQGKKVKIQIHCSYIHLLSPFPSHITQAEQQFVVYEGSATVVSAYPIKTQKTKFQLPKGTVENYSKGTELKPVTQDGQAITYGTYDNTESFTVKPVRIHFQNDSPFLSVTHMTRLIELSQWGNIAVEESYEIVHAGARLKGSFSRYDFQRDHRPNMPAVKSYHTILPAAARDVYYRDEIGNISTSHLLVRDDAVDLEIRPRFPLFGGWKTEYYIGYNIPSYEYLFVKGNRYQLNIRFIDHIFDDFIVDELTVKVILPERASNVELKTPYGVKRLPDEIHYTYLDYTGRTVVVLKKEMLVDLHIQNFQVEYTFDKMSIFYEPFLIVAFFFILFLTVLFYVRLDFTIAKDPISESRAKVSGYVEQARNFQDDRHRAYDAIWDAIEHFKNNRDGSEFQAAKKKFESECKRLGQLITDIAAQVKADGVADVAEKFNELQRYDRQIRELLGQWFGNVERFVSSKMPKPQYTEYEKLNKPKLDEWRQRTEQITFAL